MIAFGTTVGYLDLTGSTSVSRNPVVFVTIVLSIPSVCLIDPIIYSLLVIAATVSLTVATYVTADTLVTSGTYLNIIVASLMAIVIVFVLYRFVVSYYHKSDKLENLSRIDQLTGLGNRRSFDEELNRRSVTKTGNYYFVFSDIDYFKKVNDILGHAYGDKVLEEAGRLYIKHFGKHSYRYGGDEIATIADMSQEQIESIMREINKELSSFKEIQITISSGAYLVKAGTEPIKGLKKADEALYETKKNPSGKIHFYSAREE